MYILLAFHSHHPYSLLKFSEAKPRSSWIGKQKSRKESFKKYWNIPWETWQTLYTSYSVKPWLKSILDLLEDWTFFLELNLNTNTRCQPFWAWNLDLLLMLTHAHVCCKHSLEKGIYQAALQRHEETWHQSMRTKVKLRSPAKFYLTDVTRLEIMKSCSMFNKDSRSVLQFGPVTESLITKMIRSLQYCCQAWYYYHLITDSTDNVLWLAAASWLSAASSDHCFTCASSSDGPATYDTYPVSLKHSTLEFSLLIHFDC